MLVCSSGDKNKGMAGSAIAILDALMKLRQVCCDPRLVSTPSASGVEGSAKYQAFFELLEAQLGAGRRVLVFSQFARMLALLGRGLGERGIPYTELTGKTPDRGKVVDCLICKKPIGDPRKAERDLRWKPKTSFETLVAMMVDADLDRS